MATAKEIKAKQAKAKLEDKASAKLSGTHSVTVADVKDRFKTGSTKGVGIFSRLFS